MQALFRTPASASPLACVVRYASRRSGRFEGRQRWRIASPERAPTSELQNEIPILGFDPPGDDGHQAVRAFAVLQLGPRMALFYVVPKGTWWTVVKDEKELGLFSREEQAENWAQAWASATRESLVIVLDQELSAGRTSVRAGD